MVAGWRRVAAGLALVPALAAGCGGGGGKAAGDDPLASSKSAPATDDGRARTIVLQQDDMPPGWKGQPHAEDQAERDRARRLSACLGRPDPESYRSAIAYGPDLSMAQLQVSTSSTVLKTVDDARADLAAVRGPAYLDCAAAAFGEVLGAQAGGAKVQDVAAQPEPVADFGDGSTAVRLTANLVTGDRTSKLFADLVYISKERATVSATFFSIGEPFPGTLEESLVSRIGHRVAA